MNILIDRHHSGLAHSFQLLFEKRLGHTVYFPIGMEWYPNYWKINEIEATAKQYLEIGSQPIDGTPPLNDPFIKGMLPTVTGLYYVEDKHHDTIQHAVTLDRFMEMDIDIVIASIPQHIKPFKELAKMKNAKFIFQMGNAFPNIDYDEIPNLMVNTLPAVIEYDNKPPHYIVYHQEIDSVFHPISQPPERLITSFINVYANNGGFEEFMALKSITPGYEFRSYGGQNQDGCITGVESMAAIMQRSYFGFHSKRGGDGFGHVLYDWFATGRPIITHISDYADKLGGELLEHMVTCIDLDVCNINEVCDIISNMKPLHYVIMCQNVRDRFDACVNYEKEAEEIKKFLEELK